MTANDAREDEIIRAWKRLVTRIGANTPHQSNVSYINKTWCPDGAKDSLRLKQKRPDLKESLNQALRGDLHSEGFPRKIVNTREFKRLWRLVHGDLDPAGEQELRTWSRHRIKHATKEKWDAVDGKTKRNLTTCYIKYQNWETSMNQIKVEMLEYIDDYKSSLDDLQMFVEDNHEFAEDRHYEKIELGRERVKNTRKIKGKIPRMINARKKQLAKEIFNVLADHIELRKLPPWAAKIDKVTVEKNIGMFRSTMSLNLDDEKSKLDIILSRLAEIYSGDLDDVDEHSKDMWAELDKVLSS